MSNWLTRAVRDAISGPRTEGHIVQIGLDFGTAYLKVVCRDLVRNSAWVYVPAHAQEEPACLTRSAVKVAAGQVTRDSKGDGIPSVKMALRCVAAAEWNDPVLAPFVAAAGTSDPQAVRRLVEACATYIVADTLAGVRRSIENRLKGFGGHPDDYAAVNMAIPVADAQLPYVNQAFLAVLRAAWPLSAEMRPGDSIGLDELSRRLAAACVVNGGDDDPCLVYPEVSANVQGFVRSRVSQPGIYLFCDVGAGTVDLSVFIYHQQGKTDSLTYLAASVVPLGSSQIEREAADLEGSVTPEGIESLRKLKEGNSPRSTLVAARDSICRDLTRETVRTLAAAKRKLYVRDQLTKTRVIFGGGGFCEHPYGLGACAAFASDLFAHRVTAERLGMPKPTDLDLQPRNAVWMKRLSVAYGLSFERHELVPFIYPVDVNAPKPEEVWQPRRGHRHAPSKEEV